MRKFLLILILFLYYSKLYSNQLEDLVGNLSLYTISENETLIASNSNTKGLVSNFCFTYIDTLGNLRNHVYNMEKNIEGIMVMFPSRLNHQVFPFYNNKDTRISISGNLGVHSKN